ncbi:MAG: hypothetical protein O4859_30915, partial [Trichodesmium sp. St18_bin1]|nr:hypothetical protein [Trichodesmium sp. St18_bin1]
MIIDGDKELQLKNRQGKTYSDNSAPDWDGVAVELGSADSYRVLLQGQNARDGQAYVSTTNSEGVITKGSGWKSGDALSSIEEEFNIDLNNDQVIGPSDEVNITSPTSSTNIQPGESHNIQWTDNFSDNVKLELYKGSDFEQTISTSTPSDGSYSWTVPTSLSSGTNYNIKIRNVNDSSVYNYSSYFTIEPEVNITSPTSSTNIELGETYTIGWTDNFSDNVKLELYKGSSFQQTISASTPSDGSYSWTVPTSLSSGTNYNIKIRNVNDSSVYDYSSYFTIEPDEEVNITSPTSSTSLEPGESHNIRWTDNFSDNVKLELYKGSSFQQTISTSTPSDGSYSWTVPTSLSSGTNYNVKIRNVNDSSVYDYSSYFTIIQGNRTPEVENDKTVTLEEDNTATLNIPAPT